ncbi:hypothetical protein NM688_g914 [Phlebia brevispora]|uniref:Uncharacterized protein n=1 Tax=Phlebia brevispora TaxID=194682 RepID=A0ACC1TD88_9APHY|nr:hypothetical protein NM688_g914 [Phlebia brevispora]
MSSPPQSHGSISPNQLTATPETPEVFRRASGAPEPPSLTPSRIRHQNVLHTPDPSPRGPHHPGAAEEEAEDDDYWLPPTLYSGRDEQEALCCIAVEIIKKEEEREAPWYTPWGLYLQNSMRELQVPARGIVSFTMPQYPVRAEFDTYEAEFEERFSEDLRRASHGTSEQSQTKSPPPMPDAVSYRANRIPDFAQLIYWSYKDPDGFTRRSKDRFTLVIEIKALQATRRSTRPFFLSGVKSQTDEQIKFVFSGPEERTPEVIGVISTMGPYWWYREFDKKSVSPLPSSYGEYQDPSYKPSTSRELSDGSTVPGTPSASPAIEQYSPRARPLPQFLEYYFVNETVLKLGTDRSTRALRDIAKRIRGLNSDVYEYVSISYSDINLCSHCVLFVLSAATLDDRPKPQ